LHTFVGIDQVRKELIRRAAIADGREVRAVPAPLTVDYVATGAIAPATIQLFASDYVAGDLHTFTA